MQGYRIILMLIFGILIFQSLEHVKPHEHCPELIQEVKQQRNNLLNTHHDNMVENHLQASSSIDDDTALQDNAPITLYKSEPSLDDNLHNYSHPQQELSMFENDLDDTRLSIDRAAVMLEFKKLRAIAHLEKKPMIYSIGGYIKQDIFFDSRQIYSERQGQFLLYPRPYSADQCGRDYNQKGSFNMLTIETRIRGAIAGPNLFGAESYAAIEGDFWGALPELDLLGLARLRHAFFYLEWPDKSLLIGQYWHPVFIEDCYPDTVSFNNGVPIDTYAREPQVRVTKQFDNITLLFAVTSYATRLIDETALTNFQARNAIMPDINLQARARIRSHVCGIGASCRRFVFRPESLPLSERLRVQGDLFSYLAFAYAKLVWHRLSLAVKLIFAQNGYVYELISTYGIHCIEPYTFKRHYTNQQNVAIWIDFMREGKIEPGLFMGVIKNVGTGKLVDPNTVYPDIYGGSRLNYVARISPRIRWYSGPLIIAGEFEFTRAAWGTINKKGRIDDAIPVNNFRALFATYYSF